MNNVKDPIRDPFHLEINNVFYNFFEVKMNMNNIKKNYINNQEKSELHSYYIKTCLNIFKSFFHEYFYLSFINKMEIKKKEKERF